MQAFNLNYYRLNTDLYVFYILYNLYIIFFDSIFAN